MKFRRATHDRDGNFRREHCEAVKREVEMLEVDPTHWMDMKRGMTFDEICHEMQTDNLNWPLPPDRGYIARGIVRLLELGLAEVVCTWPKEIEDADCSE